MSEREISFFGGVMPAPLPPGLSSADLESTWSEAPPATPPVPWWHGRPDGLLAPDGGGGSGWGWGGGVGFVRPREHCGNVLSVCVICLVFCVGHMYVCWSLY